MVDIKGRLTEVANNFTGVITDISSADTACNNAKASIDKIPTNVAGGKVPAFDYSIPFTGATTGTIPSLFPDALGSTNAATDGSSAIYLTTEAFSQIQNGLNQVSTAAANVKNAFSSATFSSSLDTAQTTLNQVVDTLEGGDQKFY